MNNPSAFITALADSLAGDQLGERLLLAPSHRVGRQWLDQVAAILGGVANVRAVTVRRLFLDLAEPVLRAKGLRLAGRQEKIGMMGNILAGMRRRSEAGYFSRLPMTLGLAAMLLDTIEELETTAFRRPADWSRALPDPDKARELAELRRAFAAAKRRAGAAGEGEVHQAALERLAGPEFSAPRVIVPADLLADLSVPERELLRRWPKAERRLAAVEAGEKGTAPECFTAADIADEAREVLRRIQSMAVPLDKVEVTALDAAAYVPALVAACLEAFGGRPEDLPVTCAGGLPGTYSRPGRSLAAWVEWLKQGLPASGLAAMVESGLLGDAWLAGSPGISLSNMASRLRALPLGGGIGEYRRLLGAGPPDSAMTQAERGLSRTVLRILPGNGKEDVPDLADAGLVLAAADRLLSLPGLHGGKLDAYAGKSLRDEIGQWLPHADWNGFDAIALLGELAANLRVMGLGPMPGRLHIGDLYSGGQSGREFLFVMGLDDSRYPGATRQDLVLLDRERRSLSRRLQLSGAGRQRRQRAFARLLALSPVRMVVSHARRDPESGRELFPAAEFTRLAESLRYPSAPPAGFVAAENSACLGRREDWLRAIVFRRGTPPAVGDIAAWFPHFAEGKKASEARLAPVFGAYDGHVPEAGRDFLRGDAAQAVSPTDLELFAACPLDFFFKRILGVRPPERYEASPGRWLEGNVRGSLLHDLFQDFLLRSAESEAAGGEPEGAATLERMLAEAIRRQRKQTPPRDDLAFRREERELQEACAIFLGGEEIRRATGRPLYLEVALGGATEPRTPWDRVEPVALVFAPGRELRLRGRVDRIDRLSRGGLVIYDYKTGRSEKYTPGDPFRQGRHLQPYLYTRMLERTLADLGRPEPVLGFSYFFPMPRDEGRSVHFARSDLERQGPEIMRALTAMLAAGCFPFTTDAGDIAHSDYLPAHDDVRALAAAARLKAGSDPALSAWARLRGLADADEE